MWHLLHLINFVCVIISSLDCKSVFDSNNARLTKRQVSAVERIYDSSIEQLKGPLPKESTMVITSMGNIECANCILENSRKSKKCINCISQRDRNNLSCESCDFRSLENIKHCIKVCGNTAKQSNTIKPKYRKKESLECERCVYWTSKGSLRDSSCNEICSPFQLSNTLGTIVDRTNRLSWLQAKLDLLNGECALRSTPPPPIIVFLNALNSERLKNPSSPQNTAVPQFIIIHPYNYPQVPGRLAFPQMLGFGNSFYDIVSPSIGGQSNTGMFGESKEIGIPEVEFVPNTGVKQSHVLGTKIPPSPSNYETTDLLNSGKYNIMLSSTIPEKRPIRPSNLYILESSEIINHPPDLQKSSTLYQESTGIPQVHEREQNQLIFKPGRKNLSNQVLDMNSPTKRPQNLFERPISFNGPVNKPYIPGSVSVASSVDGQYNLQNNKNRPQAPVGRPNSFYEQVPTETPYGAFGRPFTDFQSQNFGHLTSPTDTFLYEQMPNGGRNVLPELSNSFYVPKYFGQSEITQSVHNPNGEPVLHSGGHQTMYNPQFPEQLQNQLGVQMLEGEIPSGTPGEQMFDQFQMENYPSRQFKIPNEEFQINFVPEKLDPSNTPGRPGPHKQNNLSHFGYSDIQGGKRSNVSPDAFHTPMGNYDNVNEDVTVNWLSGNISPSKNVYVNRSIEMPDQLFVAQNAGQLKKNYGEQNPTAWVDTFRPHNLGESKIMHNEKRPLKSFNGFVSPQKLYQSQFKQFGKPKHDQFVFSNNYGQYGGQMEDSGIYKTLQNDGHRENAQFIHGLPRVDASDKFVGPQSLQGDLKILSSQYRESPGQQNTELSKPRDQIAAKGLSRSNFDNQDGGKETNLMHNLRTISQTQDEPVKQSESSINQPSELSRTQSLPHHEKVTSSEENQLFDPSLSTEQINADNRVEKNNLMHNPTLVSQTQDEQAELMIARQSELPKTQAFPFHGKVTAAEEIQLFDPSLSTERLNNIRTFGSKIFNNQTTELYAPDSKNSGYEVAHHIEEQKNMSDRLKSDLSESIDSIHSSSESLSVSSEKANYVEKDVFDPKESIDKETIESRIPDSEQENLVDGWQTRDIKDFLESKEESTDNHHAILDLSNALANYIQKHSGRSDQFDQPDLAMVSSNSQPAGENVRAKPTIIMTPLAKKKNFPTFIRWKNQYN